MQKQNQVHTIIALPENPRTWFNINVSGVPTIYTIPIISNEAYEVWYGTGKIKRKILYNIAGLQNIAISDSYIIPYLSSMIPPSI